MMPERVFLEGYYCRKCGEEIELIDNFWQCGCYKIGAYELDCGYHEKPGFWVEHKCFCCHEPITPPYGAVIYFLGEILHKCIKCAQEEEQEGD